MLNSQFYWSARDTRADSCAASTNTVIVEKKQEHNSGGCRLFGIDICSAEDEVLPVVTAPALGYDQTAASLVELSSDKLSQPSDVNNSDAPGASSEQLPLESQSRQVRSCTKVIFYHTSSDYQGLVFLLVVHSELINVVHAGNYARNGCWKGCRPDKA